LMSRLVVFSDIMRHEVEAADGLLKVGLYSPQQGGLPILRGMSNILQIRNLHG